MKVEQKKTRLTSEEYLSEYISSNKNVVGTFISGKSGGFIIPDDDKLPQSMDVVSITDRGQTVIAQTISGKKVVGKFFDNSGKLNVVEVLERSGKIPVDVLAILRVHNLYEEFPNEVIAEARRVAKLSAEEVNRREDLREELIITIDPADAMDLDDAVGLKKNADGTYELGVHIADVSHYVKSGEELDSEAFRRGTSVYFPGGVLPMLPTQLSNNICSLLPAVDRLTLSCFMTIDKTGKVIDSRLSESVINTKVRFSYDEVQAILDGGKYHDKKISEMLHNMAELTKIIESTRRARGEVVFDIPEPKIVLDEDGKIADVVAYPHELSHRTIETFMILANETIAEYALEHSLPFVYRVHEKPDPFKVMRLGEMLKPFGLQSTVDEEYPTGQAYMKLLNQIPDEEELKRQVVSKLCLRSMQKAKYSHECLGHFGLGSKFYCHFTSPIRRYPDLVIHRIVKDMLNGRMNSHELEELSAYVPIASEQSTKTELVATEVEREVDDLKCAQYMNEHIGEVFSGTVSGITDFGVFVYLPNTVEGLIRLENMPRQNQKNGKREFWNYSERNGTMYSTAGRTIKMGDPMEVVCSGVNLVRHTVEFSAQIPTE